MTVSKPKKKKVTKVSWIDHTGHRSLLASSSSGWGDRVKEAMVSNVTTWCWCFFQKISKYCKVDLSAATFTHSTDCQWTSSYIKGSWSQKVQHCIHNTQLMSCHLPHPQPLQKTIAEDQTCFLLLLFIYIPEVRQRKSLEIDLIGTLRKIVMRDKFWTAALLLAVSTHSHRNLRNRKCGHLEKVPS